MNKVIDGKVAAILDEFRIVINVGTNDEVKTGMVFVIVARCEDEIKDPVSGEILGKLEIVKDYVTVIHVQERFSTCVSRETQPRFPHENYMGVQTLSGAMMAESMTARPGRERYDMKRMNVNTSQITGIPNIGPISAGDSVRSIVMQS